MAGTYPSYLEDDCEPDLLDPNDGDTELDKLRDRTTLHALPPRLEDEGQSGG
jgi:hypothetical protein